MLRISLLAAFFCSACALTPQPAAPVAGRLAVPGGEIAYNVAGSGPPLVLLHAGRLDNSMWDPVIPRLTAHHRVVRWDARGHGHSSAPGGPGADTADDLRRLLDSLGIHRTAIAGISMGSGTAAHFTIRHPERVERLILMSTSAPPPGTPAAAGAPPPLTTAEGRRMLAATRVPATVVVGERDSALVLETARAIAAEVPGARLIVVRGGHNVVADAPNVVAAAILAQRP
ncbi:MAG: alpha/beta fold hydrolase [Pseudomonadota bacterium]|nr:alpha/beta fold hydrolase [Pseudomonadota bacterium]